MRSKIFLTIFLSYASTVLAITLLPIHRHPASYWAGEPWWTMIHWIPGEVDAPSFVLNVIMLVPFGVLAPLLWRTVDINDLLANTLGALIGLLILRLALPHPAHRRLIRP